MLGDRAKLELYIVAMIKREYTLIFEVIYMDSLPKDFLAKMEVLKRRI